MDRRARLETSPEVAEHEPTPGLDTTVARLIDTTGLTAREVEIFALLAQGATAPTSNASWA